MSMVPGTVNLIYTACIGASRACEDGEVALVGVANLSHSFESILSNLGMDNSPP